MTWNPPEVHTDERPTGPRAGVPRTALLALLAVVALVAAGCGGGSPAAHGGGTPTRPGGSATSSPTPQAPPSYPRDLSPRPLGSVRPNVLEIVVDDEGDIPCSGYSRVLPLSAKVLRAHGTCWQNASVPDPVCCPARATIQSGEYPHNTHVERQDLAHLLDYRHTVQHRLGRSGYTTFGVGKNLNGVVASRYVADGRPTPRGKFDTGFGHFLFWSNYQDQLSPNLTGVRALYSPQGLVQLPHRESTSYVTGAATRRFITAASTQERRHPWMAYMAFYPPHEQVNPGGGFRSKLPVPTEAHRTTRVPGLVRSQINERDESDKLPLFRRPLHFRHDVALDRARERSMLDVDDQVSQTLALLGRLGELRDTLVIFTSDNGFLLGQHGWVGKGVPYVPALDVPLLTYGPGFRQGAVDDRPVSLVDLAPTIYRETGVRPGYLLDGHSLLSGYRRTGQGYEYERDASSRAESEAGQLETQVPSWGAYRQDGYEYIEWYGADGRPYHPEFYRGPRQDDNLIARGTPVSPARRALVDRLRHELHRFQHCAGTRSGPGRIACP